MNIKKQVWTFLVAIAFILCNLGAIPAVLAETQEAYKPEAKSEYYQTAQTSKQTNQQKDQDYSQDGQKGYQQTKQDYQKSNQTQNSSDYKSDYKQEDYSQK